MCKLPSLCQRSNFWTDFSYNVVCARPYLQRERLVFLTAQIREKMPEHWSENVGQNACKAYANDGFLLIHQQQYYRELWTFQILWSEQVKMEELSWAEMQDAIPSKLGPSLPLFVELGLTITFLELYGFLFGLVFIQLILILYYGHKRFSYQTVFLFTCLIWAGLRTTLFSFYINNTIEVDTMKIFCYWFFFSFPVCLQFYTLCLLVLYFAQVIF